MQLKPISLRQNKYSVGKVFISLYKRCPAHCSNFVYSLEATIGVMPAIALPATVERYVIMLLSEVASNVVSTFLYANGYSKYEWFEYRRVAAFSLNPIENINERMVKHHFILEPWLLNFAKFGI